MGSRMETPKLPDLHHANLQEVIVGPRREVTLKVQRLVWENGSGRYAPAVAVRFGGIYNFDEVKAFFAAPHYRRSELDGISYDTRRHSKPEHLYLELTYERVAAQIIIECDNISVTQPEWPVA